MSDPDYRIACARLEAANKWFRDEIASLRDAIRRLADQDATLSVQNGNVTVTMDATLTPEERDAVETAAMEAEAHQHTQRATTLRGLLERMK